MLPKNWLTNIEFLKSNKWHEPPPEYYQNGNSSASKIPIVAQSLPSICPLVCIRPIKDPAHPANGEFGLFALKNISEKQLLLEYRGFVTADKNTSQTSDYTLHFDGDYSIDAEFMGNEARFLNDYRGIGEHPSVKFDLFRDGKGALRMGVFSIRPIKKGSEILINYGKGFWKERGLL